MPCGDGAGPADNQIVRRVRAVRGVIPFEVACEPALDYARTAPKVTIVANGALFHGKGDDPALALSSAQPLLATPRGAGARFVLREGEKTTFVLRALCPGAGCARPPSEVEAQALFEETVRFWRQVAVAVHVPRPMARDRPALGAGAQAADVRSHGRDRRGADVQPARAARRRAQLGLSVHVDPRRGLHAVRAAAHRLHRRGQALHGLARGTLPRGSRRTPPLQIVYSIDGRRISRSRRSITSTATAARGRFASATAPTTSSSSTSTAS